MVNTEIRRISDKEIWIGKNRDVILEGGVISVEAVGEQTKEIGELQKIICAELSQKIEGKVNFLIDLNKCGKSDPEARKIYQEFTDQENTNKVATFGVHPVARVIASFVINITNKNSEGGIKFFKSREEALKWLLE